MTCTETRDEEDLYPKTAAGKVHVAPEAFYGVPDEMKKECRKRLPDDMLRVLDQFEKVSGT